MRIRTKLITRLIFVALLPLAVLVFTSYLNIYKTRVESVSELEKSLISQASFQVEKWLRDKSEDLIIYVLDPDINKLEDVSEEQQRTILNRVLEMDNSVKEVVIIDLNGQMRKRISKEGMEIEPEAVNFKGVESFLQASLGNSYVINRVIFEEKQPILGLTLPVINLSTKKVVAVSIIKVDISKIQELLKKFQVGETDYIFVVDRRGTLIAHSQQNDLIGQNFKDNEGVRKVLNSLSSKEKEKNNYSGISGERVLGESFLIPDFNFGVVIEWPETEALGIVWSIFFQNLIFVLIVLIGISAMAFVFAEMISNPIQKIREGAKIIGGGGFDYRIKIATKDELEELGNAFNEMTKSLKELDDLKNEMVYIAAHELRSPVTVIRGYISMVLEGPSKLPPREIESLKRADEAGQRLNDLINEILEVSRTERGRIEIKTSPCDIKEIASSLIDGYKQKAKDKNLELIYRVSEPVPKIMADAGKLKEILGNLIDNAIKCTFEGRVVVSHKIEDNFLLTSVSDTGIGMTQEELSHLFAKFFQGKTARGKGLKGTGLGLFIVKQLVEKMAGKIWAESEVGKGTTFYFTLPLAK